MNKNLVSNTYYRMGHFFDKTCRFMKNLKGKKYRVTGVVEGSVGAQYFKEGDKLSSIEVNGERHIKL